MRRDVVVSGLGIVSAAGLDIPTYWNSLLRGESRAGVRLSPTADGDVVSSYVAAVGDDALAQAAGEARIRCGDRVADMMAIACHRAWQDAGLPAPVQAPLSFRAGAILGSGLGGIQFQEEQMWRVLRSGKDRIHPHTVPRVSTTALVTEVATRLGLRGPGYVVSSACASAAHALGQAMRTIAYGDADVVVSGGAEAPLSDFSIRAFSLLGVLSRSPEGPATACKPFDERRDGFVLGEGAGALVLEAAEHARNRGACIYARLAGYGQTLGAYHSVRPRPDGEDAAMAMRLALEDANVSPDHVDYVNAHGTGTRENDVAESRAIRTVFGDRTADLLVSSIKAVTGHTLGAAGALEAVATVKTITTGLVPPTLTYGQPDPACPLRIVTSAVEIRREKRIALSNSFGFGNVNASLLFVTEGLGQ